MIDPEQLGAAANRAVQDKVRADVYRAAYAAGIATQLFVSQHHRDLALCTPNDASNLMLRAALTYLAANGLIQVADPEAYETWLPAGLTPPYDEELAAAVQEGVAQQARLNAAFLRGQ